MNSFSANDRPLQLGYDNAHAGPSTPDEAKKRLCGRIIRPETVKAKTMPYPEKSVLDIYGTRLNLITLHLLRTILFHAQ